jgi:hypothetical protein
MSVIAVPMALVIGIGAGVAASFAVQDSVGEPGHATSQAPSPTSSTTSVAVKPLPPPTGPPGPALFLAWTPGGLPPGMEAALGERQLASTITTVRRDPAELVRTNDATGAVIDEAANGFVIPMDAMAFDPAAYLALLPKAEQSAFAELADDQVLLSETSARLRRIGPGGQLTFAGGTTLTVAGVVADETVGGAEIATKLTAATSIGVSRDRYVLFHSDADRPALESALREIVGVDRPVRLRSVGETPFLRNGDAVLPQASIKERFGEFAYRATPTGRDPDAIEPDPAWVAANIVNEEVPLLGVVTCHRSIIPALRGALAELERENLGSLLVDGGYLGCYVPRTTRTGEDLSRHSWGVALDFNYPKNRTGQRSVQDERLVEIFQEWGFTWGGEWLVPDPAHFEYIRPPTSE